LYVRNDFTLTDEIVQWLYSHSNGVTSVVVSLIKDAQEMAMLDGSETLSISSLGKAYNQRLALLHNHIEIKTVKHQSIKSIVVPCKPTKEIDAENFISNMISKTKRSGEDLFSLLREQINIIEVSV
jgi:hypothetical protein